MGGISLQDGQAELPTPESTASYWHREPAEALIGHRTTESLPAKADVIVIGSGITGAFTARELVAGRREVLMLEAREACWGATGRNGGHCQPFVHGTDPAVARFELATYAFLNDLIAANKIPCDWRPVSGVQAITSLEHLAAMKIRHAELHRTDPDLAEKAKVVTDKDELAKLKIPQAVGAVYQYNAAKCWPYKLVSWVLEGLLKEHDGTFNLQTSTPATHLQRAGKSWIVHTPRGQVAARNVVLATNAYTSHLLPKMTKMLVPVRGQVCALRPPEGDILLKHSHIWEPGTSEDYLIQRDDGMLIMGGERLSTIDAGVGVSRDDTVDKHVGRQLRRALHSAVKLKAPSEDEDESLHADYEWTGIMGYSRDNHPWVGAVPASLGGADGGLWMAVGYTGHGMPVAARCGVAVAEMILDKKGGVDVPSVFSVTEKRIEKTKDNGECFVHGP